MHHEEEQHKFESGVDCPSAYVLMCRQLAREHISRVLIHHMYKIKAPELTSHGQYDQIATYRYP